MFAARDEATKALAQLAYTHYLIPIPNDLDYIATPDEVGRLIREMHEADWLDSARNDYRLGEYEGAGRIKASVRADELGGYPSSRRCRSAHCDRSQPAGPSRISRGIISGDALGHSPLPRAVLGGAACSLSSSVHAATGKAFQAIGRWC